MAHPKGVEANEIWVGNTSRTERLGELKVAGIKSARLGDVAIDIEGKELPSNYAPLIISRSDALAYDEYMMRKTFGPHWRRQ